jgi:hypothetical protein
LSSELAPFGISLGAIRLRQTKHRRAKKHLGRNQRERDVLFDEMLEHARKGNSREFGGAAQGIELLAARD